MDRTISPLMLKDFLMQDFGSCSSNGFKSFPRKQCCSSGPLFLLDKKDHSINNFNKNPNARNRSSKPASTSSSKISNFQAVINAVKNLPFSSFPAVKSLSLQNGKRRFSLHRSLSKKLFRKSFWKKGEVVIKEKGKPLSFDYATVVVTVVKAAASREITTASGGGTSNSENWSDDSECNSANSGTFSVESSSFVGKDPIFEGYKKELLNEKLSNSDPTPTTKPTCLIEHKLESLQKHWRIDEAKEQFSPVSILDCSFGDETCSPFRSRHTRFKPVNLQKRLALSQFDGDGTSNSSEQSSPAPEPDEDEAEQETQVVSIEQEAQNLLKLITSSNLMFKVDDVLILDYFMEKLEGRRPKIIKGGEELNKRMMKVAEDYVSGSQKVMTEWKVEKSRIEYVKLMEEDGTCWKTFDGEKEDIIEEVEVEIWNTLVHELLLDFF